MGSTTVTVVATMTVHQIRRMYDYLNYSKHTQHPALSSPCSSPINLSEGSLSIRSSRKATLCMHAQAYPLDAKRKQVIIINIHEASEGELTPVFAVQCSLSVVCNSPGAVVDAQERV